MIPEESKHASQITLALSFSLFLSNCLSTARLLLDLVVGRPKLCSLCFVVSFFSSLSVVSMTVCLSIYRRLRDGIFLPLALSFTISPFRHPNGKIRRKARRLFSVFNLLLLPPLNSLNFSSLALSVCLFLPTGQQDSRQLSSNLSERTSEESTFTICLSPSPSLSLFPCSGRHFVHNYRHQIILSIV